MPRVTVKVLSCGDPSPGCRTHPGLVAPMDYAWTIDRADFLKGPR
ncbi:hypothetical protein LMG29542_01755 [Paraburkholderia humisilvae]|uniref:Uncharacterized protein n=1 Tax=Paraburkholderia humisilvae TaxID=627669 RepID=A0A6J5DDU9_9BURK|nr:hypothetical protein LMG29542_01755 [Paraburkholderia humisilvae]